MQFKERPIGYRENLIASLRLISGVWSILQRSQQNESHCCALFLSHSLHRNLPSKFGYFFDKRRSGNFLCCDGNPACTPHQPGPWLWFHKPYSVDSDVLFWEKGFKVEFWYVLMGYTIFDFVLLKVYAFFLFFAFGNRNSMASRMSEDIAGTPMSVADAGPCWVISRWLAVRYVILHDIFNLLSCK